MLAFKGPQASFVVAISLHKFLGLAWPNLLRSLSLSKSHSTYSPAFLNPCTSTSLSLSLSLSLGTECYFQQVSLLISLIVVLFLAF